MTCRWTLLCLIVQLSAIAQISDHEPYAGRWSRGFWEAHWIAHSTASEVDYGVFHFAKTLNLNAVPDSLLVHVSADNRYKLYVNGAWVGEGPARGDLQNWRFETVDLAPHLRTGRNVIAAVVWNFGSERPRAQITRQTGFILQAETEAFAELNTDDHWSVLQNRAYAPELESIKSLNSYLVVGPGDVVRGADYPWGWERFDASLDWQPARQLRLGNNRGWGTDGGWMLVPREIPPMRRDSIRWQRVRRAKGIAAESVVLNRPHDLVIPAHQTVEMLLDQDELTTAYPRLLLSGGAGSRIQLTYNEALYHADGSKGNRDEIEGKEIRGYADQFFPDGGARRTYETLWWRTYRYVQLDITTGEEPLVLHDLHATSTRYPLEANATFTADADWLEPVWNAGWRTAQRCAQETYVDCPYYEQLQYVGDTRIQALISLYVSGDDRLMRRAIQDFADSRLPNGLTQSRYPCVETQLIPPYSLFWIAMLHDYWMHRPDADFVRGHLRGVASVLDWYADQLNDDGLLGNMPWWHFVDWTKEWPWDPVERVGGLPKGDADGNSTVQALQYAYALNYAAELFEAFGKSKQAAVYHQQRETLLANVRRLCWDEDRRLFRDAPNQQVFSQHAQILAILTDAVPIAQQRALLTRSFDPSLVQTTFYFKFYLFRTLDKLERGDVYLQLLQPWRAMLDRGLTTFAEKPDPTRSDCHAWSAAPNYDLLALVAGIRPAAPGFARVRIAPNFGELTMLRGSMPHPNGTIRFDLQARGNRMWGTVELPEGIPGELLWRGQRWTWAGGVFEVPN